MSPLSGIRGAAKGALHSIGLLKAARRTRDLYGAKRVQRTLAWHGFSQKHQFVVSANASGLCNRIKCLASSMRLAHKLARTVALSWTPNSDCCCLFSDLFENEVLELRDYELNAVLNRPHMFESDQWYVVDTWLLLMLPNDLPENFSKAYRSTTGKTIDHEYDRIPVGIRHDYLRYFAALVPTKFIKKEVEGFAKEFDNNTISVSIRSWPDDKNKAAALFSLENLYRVLDREEESSFFVGCDSEEVLRHITRRYGRRVISYPHSVKVGDRLSQRGMQEALIDLLLLSKNNRLKVSAYSTFSEVDWWFGGCRASIECIDSGVTGQGAFDASIDDLGRLIPSDLLERAVMSIA
jgi:hypothetical protein